MPVPVLGTSAGRFTLRSLSGFGISAAVLHRLLLLGEVYYTSLLLYNTLLHALNASNAHKCETLFGNQSPIGNGAHLATVAPPIVRPGSLCTLRRESQTVPCDGR